MATFIYIFCFRGGAFIPAGAVSIIVKRVGHQVIMMDDVANGSIDPQRRYVYRWNADIELKMCNALPENNVSTTAGPVNSITECVLNGGGGSYYFDR